MNILSYSSCERDGVPSEVREVVYKSDSDSLEDWFLISPGTRKGIWLVILHGHGSNGDQIFVRPDIRDNWLPAFRKLGLNICSPNLRGNNWMSDAALCDLKSIVEWLKKEKGAEELHLFSGSMGGFGALVYATTYPSDFKSVVALCPPTDLKELHKYLKANPSDVTNWIRDAIESAYGGTPDEQPGRYSSRSIIEHADRLTMPLLISHGTSDELVPVDFARRLVKRLKGKKDLKYVEIPEGNHDAPLFRCGAIEWLADKIK